LLNRRDLTGAGIGDSALATVLPRSAIAVTIIEKSFDHIDRPRRRVRVSRRTDANSIRATIIEPRQHS
jgi:hypothetical protein